MKADNKFLSEIISREGGQELFHVPKYQREYAWERREWDLLLSDIEGNEAGYFMGSLICVSNDHENRLGKHNVFEIIDGQQRLTTLSILMGALAVTLKEAEGAFSSGDDSGKERFTDGYNSLRTKLVIRKNQREADRAQPGAFLDKGDVCLLRVQPSAQNHNLDDYQYLLREIKLLYGPEKPPHYKTRRISRAFSFFRDRVLPKKPEELLDLVDRLNKLNFVVIYADTHSDAFTLFDSLNNRGLPLSAIDIIKNKLLAELERVKRAEDKNLPEYERVAKIDVEEEFQEWQKIITAIPDAGDQERFLRHFYHASKHDEKISTEGVQRADRSKIINIYDKAIRRDSRYLLKKLVEAAQHYGQFVGPNSEEAGELGRELAELQRIGATPAYQILLYLFSLEGSRLANSDVLVQSAKLLRKYYFRRNITDTPPTRDLDAASLEVIDGCVAAVRDGKRLSIEDIASLVLKGRGKPAKLSDFEAALRGPIYSDNRSMARYLLTRINAYYDSKEYKPDLWQKDPTGRLIWTVEHVLPQTEKLPPEWIKMIGGGDPAKAAEIQDELVDCIGNLTLSGYNSDLGTSSLAKKQELSVNQKSLGVVINIGYKNGLGLNKLPFKVDGSNYSLATAPVWTAEMIRARTDEMVRRIVAENRFPGEE